MSDSFSPRDFIFHHFFIHWKCVNRNENVLEKNIFSKHDFDEIETFTKQETSKYLCSQSVVVSVLQSCDCACLTLKTRSDENDEF